LILFVLKDQPIDGQEVLRKLKRAGWTSDAKDPFASTVAPTLSRLKFDGLVERLENGCYEITQSGLSELNKILKKENYTGI